jgi:hypothetical protein
MKKGFTLLLLLCAVLLVRAQKPLTNSHTTSYYTYIYRLDDAAMRTFYLYGEDKMNDKMLGRPVDSFRTDKRSPLHLAPGNYLQVKANGNSLDYQLMEQHSAYLKLLTRNNDIRLILLDTANRPITNADVRIGKHQIPYDAALQLYHAYVSKKDTLLVAAYQGVSNFYKITPQQNRRYNYTDNRPWLTRLWAKLVQPLRRWFGKNKYKPQQWATGYMLFNKPKFKPNDTVKLKAFLLDYKTFKPISNTRLAVRLLDSYNYNDAGKVLGYTNAYHAGGFAFEFKLADSMKLQLDRTYNIVLENADNPYNPDTQAELYRTHRKVYQRGQFYYEDYELTVNKFTLRVDKTEHGPGEQASLYFRAKDNNGLDVADGRVKVTLLTQNVQQFGDKHVFVPDTLWQKDMPLDAVGETKLPIPDSIFPKATISYSARVVFLNSNNERKEDTKYITYTNRAYKIDHKQAGDTLQVNYLAYGKQQNMKAILYKLTTGGDTLSKTGITLPANIIIAPTVANYIIKTDSLTEDIEAGELDAGFAGNAVNTKDSLKITVQNPRKLTFWYNVFSGDKLVDNGTGNNLNYQKPFNNSKQATVTFNYVWAGAMQSAQVTSVFQDKALVIDVKQPMVVYPGQQADISINVKDAYGQPVAGADVTAYALTGKFDGYRPPRIPYLGMYHNGYNPKTPLTINELENNGSLLLNWQRWGKEIGLDSIVYYQFTHPRDVYKIYEPTPDSTTQIAPFVTNNGNIVPVHMVYIDGIPVYFYG